MIENQPGVENQSRVENGPGRDQQANPPMTRREFLRRAGQTAAVLSGLPALGLPSLELAGNPFGLENPKPSPEELSREAENNLEALKNDTFKEEPNIGQIDKALAPLELISDPAERTKRYLELTCRYFGMEVGEVNIDPSFAKFFGAYCKDGLAALRGALSHLVLNDNVAKFRHSDDYEENCFREGGPVNITIAGMEKPGGLTQTTEMEDGSLDVRLSFGRRKTPDGKLVLGAFPNELSHLFIKPLSAKVVENLMGIETEEGQVGPAFSSVFDEFFSNAFEVDCVVGFMRHPPSTIGDLRPSGEEIRATHAWIATGGFEAWIGSEASKEILYFIDLFNLWRTESSNLNNFVEAVGAMATRYAFDAYSPEEESNYPFDTAEMLYAADRAASSDHEFPERLKNAFTETSAALYFPDGKTFNHVNNLAESERVAVWVADTMPLYLPRSDFFCHSIDLELTPGEDGRIEIVSFVPQVSEVRVFPAEGEARSVDYQLVKMDGERFFPSVLIGSVEEAIMRNSIAAITTSERTHLVPFPYDADIADSISRILSESGGFQEQAGEEDGRPYGAPLPPSCKGLEDIYKRAGLEKFVWRPGDNISYGRYRHSAEAPQEPLAEAGSSFEPLKVGV